MDNLGSKCHEECFEIKTGKTESGLSNVTFVDLYGNECSMQNSSLAYPASMWIGIECKKGEESKSMHLSQSMVQKLLPYLERFAKTGSVR